jgi:hypothetical protein
MRKVDIVIDIETIPDQSEGAIDRFMDDSVKVSCPFKTKADIGADLGMTEGEYKFIGAEDLRQLWIKKKGGEAKKIQAEEKWLKTSFDGGYGQIVCICWSDDDEVKTVTSHGWSEKGMLNAFWVMIASQLNARTPYFVAHNAKFDLPFLFHRSVVNQIKPVKGFKPHGRHGSDYFCTMEGWAGFNGKIGLDRLSDILGVGSKTKGMSGADVWPEYQKGNIDKIAKYCADDVELTKKIFNRLTFR